MIVFWACRAASNVSSNAGLIQTCRRAQCQAPPSLGGPSCTVKLLNEKLFDMPKTWIIRSDIRKVNGSLAIETNNAFKKLATWSKGPQSRTIFSDHQFIWHRDPCFQKMSRNWLMTDSDIPSCSQGWLFDFQCWILTMNFAIVFSAALHQADLPRGSARGCLRSQLPIPQAPTWNLQLKRIHIILGEHTLTEVKNHQRAFWGFKQTLPNRPQLPIPQAPKWTSNQMSFFTITRFVETTWISNQMTFQIEFSKMMFERFWKEYWLDMFGLLGVQRRFLIDLAGTPGSNMNFKSIDVPIFEFQKFLETIGLTCSAFGGFKKALPRPQLTIPQAPTWTSNQTTFNKVFETILYCWELSYLAVWWFKTPLPNRSLLLVNPSPNLKDKINDN